MKHTNVAPKRTLLIAFMAVVLTVGLTLPVSLASAVPSSSSKQAEAQAALDKLNDMQATMPLRTTITKRKRSAVLLKLRFAKPKLRSKRKLRRSRAIRKSWERVRAACIVPVAIPSSMLSWALPPSKSSPRTGTCLTP